VIKNLYKDCFKNRTIFTIKKVKSFPQKSFLGPLSVEKGLVHFFYGLKRRPALAGVYRADDDCEKINV
jgi:hypothetical protein